MPRSRLIRRVRSRTDRRTEYRYGRPEPARSGLAERRFQVDAMRKLKQEEELNRQAEKEQEEKLKKGGIDEITIKEGDSFIDGMPGYG
jgi:hypothetical protein